MKSQRTLREAQLPSIPPSFWRLAHGQARMSEGQRKKDEKPLDSVASERLDRLASIAILAEDLFEDEQKATRWLTAPNDALGGNSPVMHCETEIGAKQVRRVLNALEWGGVV